MLLDTRSVSRPDLEQKGLACAVQSHLKGDRNYTTEIHKLLTLEILHRLFFDNSEPHTLGRHSALKAPMGVGH